MLEVTDRQIRESFALGIFRVRYTVPGARLYRR